MATWCWSTRTEDEEGPLTQEVYPHSVDSAGAMMSGILTVMAVIVMIAFAAGFIVYSRSLRSSRSAEVNPEILDDGVHLTDPEQRATWLASGKAGSTVQQRLRNLDALRADGLISEEEWALTRMDILKDL